MPIDAAPVLRYIRAMRNVTIILPEDVAERLRVRAADNGHIVSKPLTSLVERTQRNEDKYETGVEHPLVGKLQESKWMNEDVENRLKGILRS